MARSRRTTIVSVGIIVLIVLSACSFLTQGTDSINNNTQDDNSITEPNSSETTLAPSDQGSSVDPVDNFPLTPAPITVQVTLDEANMVKGSSRGFPISIKGKTADGAPFDLYLENKLYTVDADGNLVGAFDTEVTVTPVSAIEGIPFSKGYLTAVQLGPEGLLMATPGTLTLSVPGNVEGEILTGFAANGDGSDFHLFPVTGGSYSEYSDATQFYFDVMHFSLYGVASVVQGEIEAQAGHPPASPAAQDEQELAPLLPIDGLEPLATKMQLQLMKSYSRLVKPGMNNLAATKCEQVTIAAREFSVWRSKVDKANQTDYFQDLIDSSGKPLHERFIECGKEICPFCMGLSDSKPDKVKAMQMLTLATFAEDLSFSLGYDDFGYWRQLGNKCAEKAGAMPPGGSTGGDSMGGEGTVMTPTPLTCP
jgi:hypothetical protein